MPDLKTLKDHDILMTRMARTLGADLDKAEMRGDLSPEMRHDMLDACVGCSAVSACRKYLAKTEVAEAAPDFCSNGMILMALRTG